MKPKTNCFRAFYVTAFIVGAMNIAGFRYLDTFPTTPDGRGGIRYAGDGPPKLLEHGLAALNFGSVDRQNRAAAFCITSIAFGLVAVVVELALSSCRAGDVRPAPPL